MYIHSELGEDNGVVFVAGWGVAVVVLAAIVVVITQLKKNKKKAGEPAVEMTSPEGLESAI